jgi:hypothetical protein
VIKHSLRRGSGTPLPFQSEAAVKARGCLVRIAEGSSVPGAHRRLAPHSVTAPGLPNQLKRCAQSSSGHDVGRNRLDQRSSPIEDRGAKVD